MVIQKLPPDPFANHSCERQVSPRCSKVIVWSDNLSFGTSCHGTHSGARKPSYNECKKRKFDLAGGSRMSTIFRLKECVRDQLSHGCGPLISFRSRLAWAALLRPNLFPTPSPLSSFRLLLLLLMPITKLHQSARKAFKKRADAVQCAHFWPRHVWRPLFFPHPGLGASFGPLPGLFRAS